MSYYSPNPHYAPDDFSEHRERLERCELEAGTWFAYATKRQKAAFDQAMADLRGLDAPRYDRAREAAQRQWEASTAQARALCDETIHELMASGEIPEELIYRWEEITVAQAMCEAAE